MTDAATNSTATASAPVPTITTNAVSGTSLAPVLASAAKAIVKCQVRGCKARSSDAFGCNKKAHMLCFQDVVLKDKHGTPMADLPDGCIACTKACYNAIIKAASSGSDSGRGKWGSDGKQGPDDPHTSMRILLDWMTHEGNYSRYCGKNNDGVRKCQFATPLAIKMTEETSSVRTAKQVTERICTLEDSFRNAHTFARSETGAGIEQRDGKDTFQDMVKKRCLWYYELVDIMADRSASQPKVTNLNPQDLDDKSDDEIEILNDGSNSTSEEDAILEEEPLQNLDPPQDSATNNNDNPQHENNGTQLAAHSVATATSTSNNNMAQRSAEKNSCPSSVASLSERKKRRKKTNSLLDEETAAMLVAANISAKAKMEEITRHNKKMESMEKRKLFLEEQREKREAVRLQLDKKQYEAMEWKGKSDQLEYSIKLMREYKQMKERDGLNNEQIIGLIPQMRAVANAMNKPKNITVGNVNHQASGIEHSNNSTEEMNDGDEEVTGNDE